MARRLRTTNLKDWERRLASLKNNTPLMKNLRAISGEELILVWNQKLGIVRRRCLNTGLRERSFIRCLHCSFLSILIEPIANSTKPRLIIGALCFYI